MTFEGNNYLVSGYYVENGSYVKLQNLELGYTFPLYFTRKLHLTKLRVFFSGNNLFISQAGKIMPFSQHSI